MLPGAVKFEEFMPVHSSLAVASSGDGLLELPFLAAEGIDFSSAFCDADGAATSGEVLTDGVRSGDFLAGLLAALAGAALAAASLLASCPPTEAAWPSSATISVSVDNCGFGDTCSTVGMREFGDSCFRVA